MATVPVRDANDNLVNVELPLAPGRAAATASRPAVLSDEDYAVLRPMTLGASTDLSFSNVSAQSGALVGTRVRLVPRDANCRVLFGSNPTALSTSTLLIANVEYQFALTSGDKIAAIRDASTNGILNITVVS